MKKTMALMLLCLSLPHTIFSVSGVQDDKGIEIDEVDDSQKPRRIINLVIDQGGYHYITRFKPYLTHGFRKIFHEGISFAEAFHPHAAPLTATGHATLNAGCYPAQHGIIMNSWYTPEGKLISSVQDENPKARLHSSKKASTRSASSKKIMVDGISDLAVANGIPVYSISYKDRAAIGMGGHPGKNKEEQALKNVIWFDEHEKKFTSSHEYYEKLPQWLKKFNKKLPEKFVAADNWKLCFEPSHEVYSTFAKEIYHVSSTAESIANTRIIPRRNLTSHYEKSFVLTPMSNKILCELALAALDHIDAGPQAQDPALLWISFSSLDKVGHIYGPNSLEAVDTFLHLDRIIGDFIDTVDDRYGKGKTLFVITADHGSSPIVENLVEENYKSARRIVMHEVVDDINEKIDTSFGINKLLYGFKTNQIFWDAKKLKNFSPKKIAAIIALIKKELLALKGVKHVWTFDELATSNPKENSFKFLFKNQLYKGRSGQFFILGDPFVMMANHSTGTCHRSPYRHDRHVPIMFYQGSKLQNRTCAEHVLTTQLAPTLARKLRITPCSSMIHKPLPYV